MCGDLQPKYVFMIYFHMHSNEKSFRSNTVGVYGTTQTKILVNEEQATFQKRDTSLQIPNVASKRQQVRPYIKYILVTM